MDDAARVVRFWRLVEWLTPTTFPKRAPDRREPEPVYDLFPSDAMPWEPEHPHGKFRCAPGCPSVTADEAGQEWAYGIYAGLINVNRAREEIESWLGASRDHAVRDEREPQGTSIIGFQVNGAGRVIADTLVFSTFGWAYGRLREQCARGDAMASTSGMTTEQFANAEEEIQQRFAAELAGQCLDQPRLFDFLGWLVNRLSLPESILTTPLCRVQCVRRPRQRSSQTSEEASKKLSAALEMLNSHFLDDLARVEQAVGERRCGQALRAYLGDWPARKIDLRADHAASWELIDPRWYPRGRWPGEGRHPLVFSQQVAVNEAFRRLADDDGGLMAVNGPPGTGKTTLLKDIVASVIVDRAQVLARYGAPKEAFGSVTQAWQMGTWHQRYAPLDKALRRFGIVVASSNNGAVENVTLEFPKAEDVDDDWGARASPFTEIATAMLPDDHEAWSLMAACLGNSQNRKTFADHFWGWERKTGEPGHTRVPAILKGGRAEGLLPWKRAVAAFEQALAREAECREYRHGVYRHAADAHRLARQVRALKARLETLEADVTTREARLRELAQCLEAAHQCLLNRTAEIRDSRNTALAEAEAQADIAARRQGVAKEAEAEAQRRHDAHLAKAPGLLMRWFSERLRPCRRVVQWDAELEDLSSRLHDRQAAASGCHQEHMEALNAVARAQKAVAESAIREAAAEWHQAHEAAHASVEEAERELQGVRAQVAGVREQLEDGEARLLAATQAVEAYRQRHGDRHCLQPADLEAAPDDKEPLSPWADPEWEAARVGVFLAALDLHDAFVFEAGVPLQHNLRGMMQLMRGKAPAEMPDGVADTLWASLFLMVPVVSTTFASFHRQFTHLGGGEIGWLLIDEAGQAAPQQAVGALWRSRSALVVGDPLQLTPVVTVPDQLQAALATYCEVGIRWLPGFTSTQALSDQASPCGSWIGDTWVGAPLLVHRRCESPMFEIVNAVAYENSMVHAKTARASDLSPSAWVDVPAREAEGHWVPAEGMAIESLLQALARQGVPMADVFLISPFRSVVNKLRLIAGKRPGLQAGTIHTVQGKEADVVILVLGGNPGKDGAKAWASQTPNLVNVAVSRAKHRLYVVGDRERWRRYAYFDECAAHLAVHAPQGVSP